MEYKQLEKKNIARYKMRENIESALVLMATSYNNGLYIIYVICAVI